jgi:hypothetical protein
MGTVEPGDRDGRLAIIDGLGLEPGAAFGNKAAARTTAASTPITARPMTTDRWR